MSVEVNIKYLSNAKLNFNYFSDKNQLLNESEKAFDIVAPKYPGGKYKYLKVIEDSYKDGIKGYEYKTILKNVLNKFEELVDNVDMGGSFKKVKLKITDDKRGIFDFGLASKGLYKPQEYFSNQLAIDNPYEFADNEYGNKLSGIVPFDFVKEEIVLNEKQFWYTSFNSGKKYLLTKQDEGRRAIQLDIPGAKLVYKTSTKKAYIMHEKKGGKAKMVDIYIPVNLSVSLYTALPILIVAKIMQKAGIMTRISVVRMFAENQREFFMWSYPVKDYTDEINFEEIAINGTDTRWWKVIRNSLQNINNLKKYNEYGENYTRTGGSGSMPNDRLAFADAFSRYRNWYELQIEKGAIPPLQVDKKLLICGVDTQMYSASSLDLQKTMNQIYYLLDLIDFQFNKVENVCKRIYKRLVDEKLEKYFQENKKAKGVSDNLKILRGNYTTEFKTYVQNILIDTYHYPEKGEYAEKPESAKKLEEELDDKLNQLSLYLQTVT